MRLVSLRGVPCSRPRVLRTYVCSKSYISGVLHLHAMHIVPDLHPRPCRPGIHIQVTNKINIICNQHCRCRSVPMPVPMPVPVPVVVAVVSAVMMVKGGC